jgi:plasmid rolling circle replication initiator protein Rep
MHGLPGPSGVAASPYTDSAVLEPFSKHRRYNTPICQALAMDPETLEIAKAIGNCTTSIGVEVPIEGPELGKALLRSANPCNRRLCPFCEWRRSRAWRRRFFEGLPRFHEDFPSHRAIFLTLTVKNVAVDDLRTCIDEMHRSWNRLRQRSFFPTKFWFRRTEVTVRTPEAGSLNAPTFHPHIHAVLFVPAGYFSHGYVKQTEWQKQWMDAARLDYAPVVDVRRASARSSPGGATIDQSRSAALEASKYATKATDLIAMGSVLGTYHWAVKGLRLSAASTSLKPYLSDTPIDKTELIDTESVSEVETVRGKALWFEDVQEYLFSDIL